MVRRLPFVCAPFLPVLAGALLVSAPATAETPTFRVRSDAAAPLNVNEGWAGELGEEATVYADAPFRLRMEIPGGKEARNLVLQMRRNGGEWKNLEAHDFPYPTREAKLNYKNNLAVKAFDGWQVRHGKKESFGFSADGDQRYMQAVGGARGLTAVRPLPWPVASEISIAARARLPRPEDGVSLLWGVADKANYHAARFTGDGGMELLNVVGGKETVFAKSATKILPGMWHEVEIEAEAGQLQIAVDGAEIFAGPFVSNRGKPGLTISPGKRVHLAEMEFQGVAQTPSVSVIASGSYPHGNATTDLLKGSKLQFAPGIGVSLQEVASSAALAGSHSEYEWPLVIRRYADGPEVTETGDVFQFRMADMSSSESLAGPLASVRLAVPDGHLGGTFVETPGRIGPWQASNGDLYFIMEPSETDNKFMMMKSIDGGKSWREMDGPNRPRTGDLEAVDSRLVGDRMHIIHQVTRSVRHHIFNTSDHPTAPDSWVLRDEVAATADSIAQMATMAVHSDGRIVAFYLSDRLHYVVREASGLWTTPIEIDPDMAFVNTGPQAILGRDDMIHLAYASNDGSIWYRKMLPNGNLSERVQLATDAGNNRSEYGAVLPLTYDATTDTVVVAYRLANGSLWERRVVGNSVPTRARLVTPTPTITNAVDSQQPAADLAVSGDKSIVLYVDEATRSIWSSVADHEPWKQPVLRIKDIEGSWLRGNIIRKPDGRLTYGFVFDAGSKGGTGLNRYAEIPVDGE